MTTELKLTRKEVEAMSLKDLIDNQKVESKFVELYNSRSRTAEGRAMFILMKESFVRSVSEDPNLQQCTTLSLYNSILDMAFYGIHVAKGSKPLAYLLWNNVNVGTKDDKRYEKRAYLEISPYGELSIRQALGQIKYADDPVIVYENDEYSGIVYENGQKTVKYKKNTKSESRKIIAAFMKITRMDGSVDFTEMDMASVKRLAGYSNRKNFNKGANALYTSNDGQIDEGFLKAKLIKHAFSSYPRVSNPNTQAQFVTEKIETAQDIYGLEDAEEQEVPEAQVEEATAQVINANESF